MKSKAISRHMERLRKWFYFTMVVPFVWSFLLGVEKSGVSVTNGFEWLQFESMAALMSCNRWSMCYIPYSYWPMC